jgi:hypothetical protein
MEVLLTYLDYFRAKIIEKVQGLPATDVHVSRLPSGWTPAELLHHPTFVERRWLEWGFEDPQLPNLWGDQQDGRWHVSADRSLAEIVTALRERGAASREIVLRHDLADTGQPGDRWGDAHPATLERVLLHLMQEYARHAGHLDIVSELAGSPVGEGRS